MRKLIIFLLAAIMMPTAAFSQTSPNWYSGYIPSTAQFNAAFASKQDLLGFTPINPSGGTMTGRFVTAAPTATLGGFNLTPGSPPSAPANGDIWTTSTGAFARIGGVTYQINQNSSRVSTSAIAVDFNTAGDNAIPIKLPVWATRYIVDSVRISNASHTLVTATAGVFTAASGGGVAVVTAASAITVSATADATNNNAQAMTINNSNTESYLLASQPNLYFRIGTPEGVAATANVTISVTPLP